MPSISAAAENTTHITDIEAQTAQIKPNETQGKSGGYLKRAVFTTCALGFASGLAQAFRTQNLQPHYSANRQLQSRNETAATIPEDRGTNTTALSPTPEPTLEHCPKGTYRHDPKTKNKDMRNLKIALAASGGTTLASIMAPSLLCCTPLSKTASRRNSVLNLSLLVGTLSGPTFLLASVITMRVASSKPDGLCHKPQPHSGGG